VNQWKALEEWPESAEFALYLQSEGSANSRKGDGLLGLSAPIGEQPRDVFVYDPEVPVLAPGGAQSMSGPFDQAAAQMGNNLLVYTSEPASAEVEIVGQPRILLYASTSAQSADFTAKLTRVSASGRAEFICIGIIWQVWICLGYDSSLGVHVGADFLCACSGRAFAA
jgi:putative CocE/NonD family hydrolase